MCPNPSNLSLTKPLAPSPSLSVREYQSIPRLDTYDAEHLDEDEYDAMDPGARAAAEKAMKKRDRQVGKDSDRFLNRHWSCFGHSTYGLRWSIYI